MGLYEAGLNTAQLMSALGYVGAIIGIIIVVGVIGYIVYKFVKKRRGKYWAFLYQ